MSVCHLWKTTSRWTGYFCLKSISLILAHLLTFFFSMIFGVLWRSLLCIMGEFAGGGSVAVADGIIVEWNVARDTWTMTGDTWHMIPEMWHMTCVTWYWCYYPSTSRDSVIKQDKKSWLQWIQLKFTQLPSPHYQIIPKPLTPNLLISLFQTIQVLQYNFIYSLIGTKYPNNPIYSIFWPIPPYTNLFQPNPTYSSPLKPIPAHFSQF